MAQPSLAIATAVSAMRLEKPHSLSYQDSTRTKRPSITCVWVESKVELAGLWLKSIETSGASLKARMPFSAPPAASLIAALTSCEEVSRLLRNLKSTIDTLGDRKSTRLNSSH